MHLFNMGISCGQGYFYYHGTPENLMHINSADRSMVIGRNRDKFNSAKKHLPIKKLSMTGTSSLPTINSHFAEDGCALATKPMMSVSIYI